MQKRFALVFNGWTVDASDSWHEIDFMQCFYPGSKVFDRVKHRVIPS